MQRFCTILPVYLAHFSRSHDHITWPCNLSALIQQALSWEISENLDDIKEKVCAFLEEFSAEQIASIAG
jgi:hypothetical protein